jgi:hypothetical protein
MNHDDNRYWDWFQNELKKGRVFIDKDEQTKKNENRAYVLKFDGRVVHFYYGYDRRDTSWLYVYHFLDNYQRQIP